MQYILYIRSLLTYLLVSNTRAWRSKINQTISVLCRRRNRARHEGTAGHTHPALCWRNYRIRYVITMANILNY